MFSVSLSVFYNKYVLTGLPTFFCSKSMKKFQNQPKPAVSFEEARAVCDILPNFFLLCISYSLRILVLPEVSFILY